MYRINKKAIYAVTFILFVAMVSFAILSYSFAGNGDNGEATPTDSKVLAAGSPESQIDVIIDNSINGETDKLYHVLEIVPQGAVASGKTTTLEDMTVKDGVFEKLVLNENRSENYPVDFAAGNISYNRVECNASVDLTSDITSADLIYVSGMYDSSSDFSEATKLALQAYATTFHKPLIIDSYRLNDIISQQSRKSVTDLVSNEFISKGGSKQTYVWNGASIDAALGSSVFLPIHGNKVTWSKITDTSDPSVLKPIGRILSVKNGTSPIYDMFKADLGSVYTKGANEELPAGIDEANVYKLDPSSKTSQNLYFQRENKPEYISLETLDLTTDLTNIDNYNLSDYDLIIFEDSTKSVTDISAAYNSFASAMNSNVHIVYASTISSSGNTKNGGTSSAANFSALYSKLATGNDVSNYGNVLVCSSAKMNMYSVAKNGLGVKEVADVINAGSFRGIAGYDSGDASAASTYTVLEIEPSYPIDMDLAKWILTNNIQTQDDELYTYSSAKSFLTLSGRAKITIPNSDGYYYLRTSDVINNSPDEISYDGKTALSSFHDDVANTTDYSGLLATVTDEKGNVHNATIQDYYRWTLSNAKVAHALGYDETTGECSYSSNQVRVVHMSSYEFNTSRKSLLDNYDMIFIGGDNSAYKSKSNWANGGDYTVYWKDGDNINTPAPTVSGTGSGSTVGNDISDAKRKELIEYSKKLPVVVDISLASLDGVQPDSNMATVINSVKTDAASGSSPALFGFDSNKTIKIANIDEQFGPTIGGYATVFAGQEKVDYLGSDDAATVNTTGDEAKLADKMKNYQRPKIKVTSMPQIYTEGDSSTEISVNDFKYKYSFFNNENYTVRIYVDNNSDSQFDETYDTPGKGECFGKGDKSSASIDAKMFSSDYFGGTSWKLVATDSKGRKTSVTGVSKVRRDKKPKMEVNLLQIVPQSNGGDTTNSTLFLCTECQRARKIIKGNPYTSEGKYHVDGYIGLTGRGEDNEIPAWCYLDGSFHNGAQIHPAGQMWPDGTIHDQWTEGAVWVNAEYEQIPDAGSVNYNSKEAETKISKFDKDYVYTGKASGVHVHKFGFAKYDENFALLDKSGNVAKKDIALQGIDNNNSNWFDDVNKDYDVNVTIMTIDEFQALCTEVNNLYSKATDKASIDAIRDAAGYQTKATNYKLYYDCMRDLINGTYTKNADFETFMLNSFGYTSADLNKFAKAPSDCNQYIINHKTDFLKYTGQQEGNASQLSDELDYISGVSADGKAVPNDQKKYSDIFMFYKQSAQSEEQKLVRGFYQVYDNYRNAIVFEQYFKERYEYNQIRASVFDSPVINEITDETTGKKIKVTMKDYDGNDPIGKINLNGLYNCIAIGAADDFADKDISVDACKDLYNYANVAQGSLILFHDTLTAPVGSHKGTKNMTTILGSTFGMVNTKYTQRTSYYDEQDNQADNTNKPIERFATFWYESETNNQMYQVNHDAREAVNGVNAVGTPAPTDKATQNNNGIITMYPFSIGERLQISPTSAGGYAANVGFNGRSQDMTVYYSLSGGTSGTHSSLYAANPNDGADNYFLYQFGNVFYTGAGHSNVTGLGRCNNDERRLLINVILNSAKRKLGGASVELFDSSSYEDTDGTKHTTNNVVVPVEGDNYQYKMSVSAYDDVPEFSFVPSTSNNGFTDVLIFFDLDHDATTQPEYDSTKDKLIYKWTSASGDTTIANDVLKKIYDGTEGNGTGNAVKLEDYTVNTDGSISTALHLKEDYFINGYAYLTVIVKDDKGKTAVATIRIELSPELLDLN